MGSGVLKTIVVVILLAALAFVAGSMAADGVKQIVVKILYTAGFQLGFQQGTDFFLGGEEVSGKLIGQNVLVPRVTGSQAFPDGGLTLAADVAVGGVEVVEAPL